jgi:hypothetical protein
MLARMALKPVIVCMITIFVVLLGFNEAKASDDFIQKNNFEKATGNSDAAIHSHSPQSSIASSSDEPTVQKAPKGIEANNNNHAVSGSGSGMITCADGRKVEGASISLVAFKDNFPLYGSWEVVAFSISDTSKNTGGSFHAGNIISNQYSLSGREISDSICKGSTPMPAIISGQCGHGTSIELETGNGERGVFSGDVTCS